MKYPLKQQKAHSLVLTQIIQPGTRSRKTAREAEKSLSLPPPAGTVRLHVSYFTPPEMRRNFPSPFQQSLVNTVCGEARASPAFPEPGRAGHRAPCRGGQKRKPPRGADALAAVVALPGPRALLPAGWESLPGVPFVAAASAEDFPADRGGLWRHRSNLAEGRAGGPRNRCRGRAAGVGGAQPRPGPSAPERAKSAGALGRACAVRRRRARYLRPLAGWMDGWAAGAPLAAGSAGRARRWLCGAPRHCALRKG